MLKNAFRANFARDLWKKTVHFLAFLTSEMDSATSNYVKNVFHSFGPFFELDLFDSVIRVITLVSHVPRVLLALNTCYVGRTTLSYSVFPEEPLFDLGKIHQYEIALLGWMSEILPPFTDDLYI